MLRTRECPDNAQHLFFYHFIYLDAAVSERRHVPCNYRLDPRPKRMDRRPVGVQVRWDGRKRFEGPTFWSQCWFASRRYTKPIVYGVTRLRMQDFRNPFSSLAVPQWWYGTLFGISFQNPCQLGLEQRWILPN